MTGKLAIRFVVNEPDTLTGMQINFPSVNPSSNGKGLELMVWDELLDSGVLHRQSFQIVNNDRQDFNEIVFSPSITIPAIPHSFESTNPATLKNLIFPSILTNNHEFITCSGL